MAIPAVYNFSFQAQELIQKLRQTSRFMLTGYWHCQFPGFNQNSDTNDDAHLWYLALSQGRVIFSDNQQISGQALFTIFQRYLPHLRGDDARQSLTALEQWFVSETQRSRSPLLPHLLSELYKLNLVSPPQIERALRLKILADCDTYLFDRPGQAQFLPMAHLQSQSPIAGFEIENLLSEAIERQAWWHKLQTQIPSMDSVPILHREAMRASNLTIEQQHRLELLVSSGKTLNDIAFVAAQDALEIAKVFAKLINQGLVSLKSTFSLTVPEVVVVDDSPILLKQFESLVTSWGYSVKSFSRPADALQSLRTANPTIIFLDINMPDVTGFDLVKQIRRFPDLDSVPLVMLTAERTLSNNWRARWSGCKFLTKPLIPDEVPQFQMELRMLLAELAPLQSSTRVSSHSTESVPAPL